MHLASKGDCGVQRLTVDRPVIQKCPLAELGYGWTCNAQNVIPYARFTAKQDACMSCVPCRQEEALQRLPLWSLALHAGSGTNTPCMHPACSPAPARCACTAAARACAGRNAKQTCLRIKGCGSINLHREDGSTTQPHLQQLVLVLLPSGVFMHQHVPARIYARLVAAASHRRYSRVPAVCDDGALCACC